MTHHNIKQIVRSLWRYKSFSLINFAGLSIGIGAIVIIFMIADYERSFDNFHSATHIYRIVIKSEKSSEVNYDATVPFMTARLLRLEYTGGISTQVFNVKTMAISFGNRSPFEEKNIVFADSVFFRVMDFANINKFWIKGDPGNALNGPHKAVLTESTAARYFGNADPIGQILKLDNKTEVQIAGIIRDIPSTTHLPANIIVSFQTLTKDFIGGMDLDQWGVRSGGYAYVKLRSAGDVHNAENALATIVKKNEKRDKNVRETFYLQPLKDIHFNPQFETSNPNYSITPRYLTMLLLLGGFILLIACVNYINLSTSLAFTKSKEVGIRKAIGASRSQLFILYLSETFLLTTIAAAMGILLALTLLPSVNGILDKSLNAYQLLNIRFIVNALLLIIIVSVVSGGYPAIILSGFNPIYSLKNQVILPGKTSTLMRKGLVVFQFTTSIVLIICTIVIATQMNYFRNKSLGFNKEAVIEVGLPSSDSIKMEKLRTLLQSQHGITQFAFCLGAPISDNGFFTSMHSLEVQQNSDYSVKIIPSDKNYLSTYGLNLVAGRWFFESEEKTEGTAVVVNETLIRKLGYKTATDAIGKRVQIGINHMKPVIIGVTQDFHINSLHEGITPCILMPFHFFYYAAAIRIDPVDIKSTLSGIEKAWRNVYPDDLYKYSFVDETLAHLYEQETKDYALFKAFSVVSVFICCIGLWGLIAFVVVRKTKEIGIRKILGASVRGIVLLLSKDFLKLVAIALVIASPIAWYSMDQWLRDFAYRVNIQWWVFALAGGMSLLIALITVSFQSVKAAIANPVKNLRTE